MKKERYVFYLPFQYEQCLLLGWRSTSQSELEGLFHFGMFQILFQVGGKLVSNLDGAIRTIAISPLPLSPLWLCGNVISLKAYIDPLLVCIEMHLDEAREGQRSKAVPGSSQRKTDNVRIDIFSYYSS